MNTPCHIIAFCKRVSTTGGLRIAIIIGTLVLAACGSDEVDDFFHPPSSEPIRSTVRTSIPLAYVASAAMAAVNGHTPPDTTASNTCSDYPCTAFVTVEQIENALPFTLSDNSASALVVGLWSSANEAVLTASFVEAPVGTETYQVTKISTFPVIESILGDYEIIYADIDINIAADSSDSIDLTDEQIQAEYDRLEIAVSDDPEINLSMDAWIIEVHDNGTPDVLNDDVYIINGGGQYAHTTQSSAEVVQLGMAGTRVAWDCSTNPTQGLAVMNEVGASSGDDTPPPLIANALIGFEPECDATAEVVLATGNWLFASGDSIPLDLNAD